MLLLFPSYNCVYVLLTLCTLTFSLSLPPLFYQGSTLLLPFVLTIPIDVTAKLVSRERGGAFATKNPDPYYSESTPAFVAVSYECDLTKNNCLINIYLNGDLNYGKLLHYSLPVRI